MKNVNIQVVITFKNSLLLLKLKKKLFLLNRYENGFKYKDMVSQNMYSS